MLGLTVSLKSEVQLAPNGNTPPQLKYHLKIDGRRLLVRARVH